MSNIIDPYKKFSANSTFIPRLHLCTTTFITESLLSDRMWASIRSGYQYFINGNGSTKTKMIGMYYSLLNAAYTSNRLIFVMTRNGLRKIFKEDSNLRDKKLGFSNGDRNNNHMPDQSADQTADCTYAGFLAFLQKSNFVKILNVDRKSRREPAIFQIVDPDFVPFFDTSSLEVQREECFNFIKKKRPADKSSDKSADQSSDLALSMKTSSSPTKQKNTKNEKITREAEAEEKKKIINSTPYNLNLDHYTINVRKLVVEKIDQFTKDIKFGPKNSNGKKIEQKVEEFLDFVPRLGPVIPEAYIYNLLEDEFKDKDHPSLKSVFETYKKFVKYTYNKNLKQYEQNKYKL